MKSAIQEVRWFPRRVISYAARRWRRFQKQRVMMQLLQTRGRRLASELSFPTLRERTLGFVEAMRVQDGVYGQYCHAPSLSEPVLYSSLCAALTRHLYRDLDSLSPVEKQEWIAYINSFQGSDGLFRDPIIENELADTVDWWGWRHMTLHAVMALTALGSVVAKTFAFLDRYLEPDTLISWLESRDWQAKASPISNAVQNVGVLLQYARDFHGSDAAGRAVDCLLDWLDKTQNPRTGSWGPLKPNSRGLSDAVQTGYHLWLLYFYDHRPLAYVKQIVDCALDTQVQLGGFGVEPNSTACDDIDSIDPLVRLLQVTHYRRTDIRDALGRALPWVLTNLNDDGGFVFLRDESFYVGHELTSYKKNESAMFPTWFRTLSLAYLAQALPDAETIHFDWPFIDCPGHQFWDTTK